MHSWERKNYLLQILILTSTMALPSCKGSHCDPVPTVFHPVPKAHYAAIPYHGRDTLHFLHNKKDTVTYYGQGAFHGKQHFSNLQGDCYVSEEDLETYFMRFKSSQIKEEIKISLKTYEGGAGSNFYFESGFGDISVSTREIIYDNFTIPSVQVLGKEYRRVYSNRFLYYNKSTGIIRIQTSKDTLELIPK